MESVTLDVKCPNGKIRTQRGLSMDDVLSMLPIPNAQCIYVFRHREGSCQMSYITHNTDWDGDQELTEEIRAYEELAHFGLTTTCRKGSKHA